MISASILDAMVKAGCTAEQLVAVVRADEGANAERDATRREQARIRKQRQRARNAGHALQGVTSGLSEENDEQYQAPRHAMSRVTKRDQRDTPTPDGSSPEPLSPLPHPPSPPKGGSVPPSPTATLATVLDAEHAKAVVDHRQRIRKPLTAYAAQQLATKFRACPNPNDAADTMIANGWQGFEPAWLESRTVNHRAQPPPEPTLADFFADKARRLQEEEDAHTIETSYERRDFDGPRQDLPRPPTSEG